MIYSGDELVGDDPRGYELVDDRPRYGFCDSCGERLPKRERGNELCAECADESQ